MNKNLKKDYELLAKDFEKKLINISLIVIMIQFLIEVIYFPMCLFSGMIQVSLVEYILVFIVRPTFVNLLAYAFAKHSYGKYKKESRNKENINKSTWLYLQMLLYIIFIIHHHLSVRIVHQI